MVRSKKYNPSLWLFLLGTLLLLIPTRLHAQNDCASKIQEAQKFYDLGMIEDIPKMLVLCLEQGNRAEKIEAYKLIILTYLFDDNQFEAERTMTEFLRKYPEYEIMPNDPIEFVYLFESYRTTSVFSFGLNIGANLTDPRVIEPYTLFDNNNASTKNSFKPGFTLGLGVGRYISRKMFMNLECNFVSNNYTFHNEIRLPVPEEKDAINAVTYTERLNKLEIPLTLAYEFSIKKTHYFIRTGISVAKITGITGHAERKFSEELASLSSEDLDIKGYRKNLIFGAIAGVGMRYKVPRGVISIDLRANIGLNNIVKKDQRWENQDFITKYYHVDDDFSINTFSLTAGYYFSFYKPKKQR
jgi:hypothetical protein